MDSRDFLILGGLGLAGFFAWRWWKKQPVTDQAQQPSSDVTGAAASSMTPAAARSTVFGGGTFMKGLLSPPMLLKPKAPTPAPTQTGTVADWEMGTNGIQRNFVLGAILGPLPVAPSPNNDRFSTPDGNQGALGTQPAGSPPQPGDPSPTFTNPLFAHRGLL